MGDWKVKIKLLVPVVLIIILFASTLTVAARPSYRPDRTYRKGMSDAIREFLYNLFVEIADRLYEKNGKVPQGILNALSMLGR